VSLFSTSKELVVQTLQDVFSSKEEKAIKAIVRQVLAEPQYAQKLAKKNAQLTPMPGRKNPPPLPDNLQNATVTEPTVVVNGACTFYGYS
jgi:hypothetical protein